jgi:hypothetical protein
VGILGKIVVGGGGFNQFSMSTVYRSPMPEKPVLINTEEDKNVPVSSQTATAVERTSTAGSSSTSKMDSKNFNPVNIIKHQKLNRNVNKDCIEEMEEDNMVLDKPTDINEPQVSTNTPSTISINTQENLERRLNIEEEVTFVSIYIETYVSCGVRDGRNE